jgi:hypothetical protein
MQCFRSLGRQRAGICPSSHIFNFLLVFQNSLSLLYLVSGHFQSSKAALEVSTEPTGHLALSGSLSGQGQDWWRSEAPPLPTFSVFSTITSGMKAIGHLRGGKFSVAVLISKPPPALLELATTLGVTCWPLAEKREMTLLGHHLVFRNRGNC